MLIIFLQNIAYFFQNILQEILCRSSVARGSSIWPDGRTDGRTDRLTAPDGPPNGPDGPPNGPDGPPNGPDGPPNGLDGLPNGPDGLPNGPDGLPNGSGRRSRRLSAPTVQPNQTKNNDTPTIASLG